MNIYRHARATMPACAWSAARNLSPSTSRITALASIRRLSTVGAIGLGIQSMIARAAEQGGSLSIERLGRGTLVRVKLPLPVQP